jgi:hypothetical protein
MAPGKGYIIRGSNSLNNPPSTINAVFTGILLMVTYLIQYKEEAILAQIILVKMAQPLF